MSRARTIPSPTWRSILGTAAWSKGRNAHYPYYFCHTKGCAENRRSVRRDKLEGEFEALLKTLQPAGHLLRLAEKVLRDSWALRLTGSKDRAKAARAEIARIERQTGQVMERILQADNPALIAAYEDQIGKLAEMKASLEAQAKRPSKPLGDFDDTFRTACAFLANPCNLWASDRLADKRLVLSLAFDGHLAYDRKEGFRTAILSLPFKALAGFSRPECGLVEPKGVEPSTSRVRF